jgi:hypothetical protein
MMKYRQTKSRHPLRRLDVRLCHIPGVPLRFTLSSILPPAPQAENVNIHFAQNTGNDNLDVSHAFNRNML